MSVKFLMGEDGSKLKILEHDGFYIPTFPFPTHAQEYAKLPTWKARDDDLLVSAYPKSGTHWLWEVVSMLKQHKAERIDAIKEWNMIEGIEQANFDSLPSPRILNTHIYFRHLPKDFKNRKCKILYILRNPKDVAVSFYNHHLKVLEYEYSGSWEHYLTRMSVKFLMGEDGSKLKILEHDGFYIPTFPFPTHAQEYAKLPTWKARDDDLLVSAYPKSGTHWLWEVVSMLKQHKAERIDAIKEWNMIEGIEQANFDSLPSPRILNTHIYFRHLPKDFKNRKCKILYILRNPKDVAVSFYNHHLKVLEYEYSGSWEHYLTRYLKGDVDYGSWFEYTLDWERVMEDNPEYPIHTLHYESMKQNSLNEIKRIAKFLEIEVTDDLVREIDDLCSFEKMKKEKNKHEDVNEWKDKEPGMYRKGQVGDWKNWFTVAQDDLFDKFYKEKMSKSKVKMQFSV